jgi:CYTH domain-containing protein
MIEIERKFTLKNTDFLKDVVGKKIVQGYLSNDPQRAVRVRIKDTSAFLTIKGISSNDGLSRYEWEKEIPVTEAQDLIKLCLPGMIDKTRYEVVHANHTWEIDVFHAANKGLTIAEVELQSDSEIVQLPEWIDQEVTGNKRYYNSYLSEKPFSEW